MISATQHEGGCTDCGAKCDDPERDRGEWRCHECMAHALVVYRRWLVRNGTPAAVENFDDAQEDRRNEGEE